MNDKNSKAKSFLTVREASKTLNLSERYLATLCRQRYIPGAIKNGQYWLIPSEFVSLKANKKQTSVI